MEEQIQQPTTQQPEIVEKMKSKWMLWLIIALIVIGVGVGAYFLFAGGGASGIGGSSIPSPPSLPA